MILDILASAYPFVKAFHVIAVIAWMAGLLYLPRLYVYHAAEPPGSATAATFAVMERRLLKLIMNPAMIAVWILGLVLSFTPGIEAWSRGWFHVKFAAILGLTVVHHMLARDLKAFAAGRNVRSPRYFRILNEVPTALMIVIVLCVIVKPF